uniref:interferon-stimulated 20 kDa exonuclease-like 2 n=1 Tax=Solea senegalensis TaxID=28829 RepID=UPI001CD8DC40|nr:interferon-stimulated 20 kDa exonuclease-like 2 [Solea senegalensis]
MSNFTNHVRLSGDNARGGAGNFKRKNIQFSERKRFLEGKHKNNQHGGWSRLDYTPRHNGACSDRPAPPAATTQRRGLAHAGSRPSGSAHSLLPSSSLSVNTTAAAAGPSTSSSSSAAIPTKYLAFDCEMVGAGPKGHISQLARCSIVSYDGDVVYDKFIHPSMPVTDYRTRWSGIRRSDLVNATPYTEARKEILKLLMGKVVIGHAVHNDFKVLGYSHPKALTRDTSRIPLLNLKAGFAESECASLKRLTKAIFNRDIQVRRAAHSTHRATMELYKVVEEEWEGTLASKPQGR